MAERVASGEMPKVPVDELPIEAVVVAYEDCLPAGILLKPARKILHRRPWVVEAQCFLARETAHGERFRYPSVRYGLQLPMECVLKPILHQHSAKANHAVVARYGAVSLHVHHYICHYGSLSVCRSSAASSPRRRGPN